MYNVIIHNLQPKKYFLKPDLYVWNNTIWGQNFDKSWKSSEKNHCEKNITCRYQKIVFMDWVITWLNSYALKSRTSIVLIYNYAPYVQQGYPYFNK